MKMAGVRFVSELTIVLFSILRFGSAVSSGSWSSPAGCAAPNCDYTFSFMVDSTNTNVNFTVTGKQASGTWVAFGCSVDTPMQNQDVYLGYVDSGGAGQVMDMWVGARYSTPVADTSSNLQSSSITYASGIYTMTLVRPLISSDSQDMSFDGTTGYYFKYPVGGGQMSGSTPQKHSTTPIISDSKIVIGGASAGTAASGGSTTTLAPGGSAAPGGSSVMPGGGSSMMPGGGSSSMMPGGGSFMMLTTLIITFIVRL